MTSSLESVELIRPIAEGGFGAVWEGRHATGKRVAVKLLHATSLDARLGFEAEVGAKVEANLTRSHRFARITVVRNLVNRRCRAAASPSAVRQLIEQNSEVDVRDALAEVSAPSLVVHRSGDLDALVDEGRFIADAIEGAHFVELEGADHFVGVDPDQILDPVAAFIRSL